VVAFAQTRASLPAATTGRRSDLETGVAAWRKRPKLGSVKAAADGSMEKGGEGWAPESPARHRQVTDQGPPACAERRRAGHRAMSAMLEVWWGFVVAEAAIGGASATDKEAGSFRAVVPAVPLWAISTSPRGGRRR